MNNNLKKSALLLLAGGLLSCSYGHNPDTRKITATKTVEFLRLREGIPQSPVIIDLGQDKGATFSINISFSNFSTRANQAGAPAKSVAEIDHYLVYLIKNANAGGYPAGGNPLANIVSNGGPYNITNAGTSSRTITFMNVGPSGTDTYYVAVRAQDANNNDLIENGNNSGTNWTGTIQGIAVSTAGLKVDSANQVSSLTSLTVTPHLRNLVSASLGADLTLNPGNTRIDSNITASFSSISSGTMSTIAGTGTSGNAPPADSVATSTTLSGPQGVGVDAVGNVYIANTNNHSIRKVTPAGIMSTIAGTGTAGNAPVADSVATSTILNSPNGVAVDAAGNVYIANTTNHTIRKVTPAGIMSTIAGTGTSGHAPVADSVATSTILNAPQGVAVDIAGNVYIANTNNHSIRKVTPAGIMSTIAGTGTAGNAPVADSVATSTALNAPQFVAVDAAGNIYITNTSNNSIRKVTPAGIMSTIAGTGTSGNAPVADSVATSTTLSGPQGVSVDIAGNVYIANTSNHTIRKVTPAGIMSTIAGTGTAGNAPVADSVATSTVLNSPNGVAVDAAGNIYIANTSNDTIRKVFK